MGSASFDDVGFVMLEKVSIGGTAPWACDRVTLLLLSAGEYVR